jgi:uncharacterized protein with NRDE domain
MCTLIALHRCVPGLPLVVAANRDEYLDRPARPPALQQGPRGLVAAPLDERAGGTWLGLNPEGLFAGLTNRPCPRPDPTRRSRGLLVLDALGSGSAAEAAERMRQLAPGAYNPFNLLLADGREAFALVYDEGPRLLELAPGAHVIGNADPDDRAVPKLADLIQRADEAARSPAPQILPALGRLCRSHDGGEGPLGPPCVHTPTYGTRSSTLLCLGEDARADVWRFADGPPCTTRYRDFTPLLTALRRSASPQPGERGERKAS